MNAQRTTLRTAIRTVAIVLLAAGLAACGTTNIVADKSRRFDQAAAAYDAGDYAGAYAIWMQLANENDLAAMRNAAHLLRKGMGVKPNAERALDLYTEAARKGLVLAMANVAEMHLNGEGTLKDPEEAARWYTLAANGGLSIAMVRLAEMFEQGVGVPKDPDKARQLYERAARNGYAPAEARLTGAIPQPQSQPALTPVLAQPPAAAGGRMASSPVVDDMDRQAAARAGRPKHAPSAPRPAAATAAQAGPGLAPIDLQAVAGLPSSDTLRLQAGQTAYQAGQMADAFKLWRGLADKGVSEAQGRIAYLFEYGQGVGADPLEAYRWYKLAAQNNNPLGVSGLSRVAGRLSAAERAIAESLAAPAAKPAKQ